MSPQVAFQLESTDAPMARLAPATAEASVELYWLPLGAGGWFVRLNGASGRPCMRAGSTAGRSTSITPPWSCASPRAAM